MIKSIINHKRCATFNASNIYDVPHICWPAKIKTFLPLYLYIMFFPTPRAFNFHILPSRGKLPTFKIGNFPRKEFLYSILKDINNPPPFNPQINYGLEGKKLTKSAIIQLINQLPLRLFLYPRKSGGRLRKLCHLVPI